MGPHTQRGTVLEPLLSHCQVLLGHTALSRLTPGITLSPPPLITPAPPCPPPHPFPPLPSPHPASPPRPVRRSPSWLPAWPTPALPSPSFSSQACEAQSLLTARLAHPCLPLTLLSQACEAQSLLAARLASCVATALKKAAGRATAFQRQLAEGGAGKAEQLQRQADMITANLYRYKGEGGEGEKGGGMGGKEGSGGGGG